MGCSTLSGTDQSKSKAPSPAAQNEPKDKSIVTPSGVKITPYEEEQIKRQKMRVVVPPQKRHSNLMMANSFPPFAA